MARSWASSRTCRPGNWAPWGRRRRRNNLVRRDGVRGVCSQGKPGDESAVLGTRRVREVLPVPGGWVFRYGARAVNLPSGRDPPADTRKLRRALRAEVVRRCVAFQTRQIIRERGATIRRERANQTSRIRNEPLVRESPHPLACAVEPAASRRSAPSSRACSVPAARRVGGRERRVNRCGRLPSKGDITRERDGRVWVQRRVGPYGR